MINDRFKDAPWVVPNISVMIGGAGGIGSWLSLFLSRIGYQIYLYDFDRFEEHNLGGQFAKISNIGQYKTTAIRNLSREFGVNTSFNTVNERYDENSPSTKFMFSAFDNMKARQDMFENWFRYNKDRNNETSMFIDGRLSMEQLQIFCVTPVTTKKYREKYLFDDSEVEDAPCTLQQTSHSAAMIASLMTGFFTNHISNVEHNNKARVVPFEYEYFIPLHMHHESIQ